MDYKLRKIEPKDDEQVALLIRSVMTEFGCVGEGYSIMDPEVDAMSKAYSGNKSAFFVVEDKEGYVLGCGGIAPLAGGDETTCELRKMYFYPDIRGKGFGKMLLSHCLEAAQSIGYKVCYLETVQRMKAANGLYQKYGFEPLNSAMGNTGHTACDQRYVKQL